MGETLEWIQIRIPRHEQKIPSDLLVEEDVIQLIESTRNKRDRAFVALLCDIGPRISEIGNMRIGDVYHDKKGIAVHISGKTGPRRCRATFSVTYVEEWLAVHPRQPDPNAPPLGVYFSPKTGVCTTQV